MSLFKKMSEPFKTEKWETVGTLKCVTNWMDTGEQDYCTIIFKESTKGNRKVDYDSTEPSLSPKDYGVYHSFVIPWFSGMEPVPLSEICDHFKHKNKIEESQKDTNSSLQDGGNVVPFRKINPSREQ